MGNRCSECNKFVSFGEPEVDIDTFELEENTVVGTVTVDLTCAECGGTLREGSLDFEILIEHECDGKEIESDDVAEFEVTEVEAEPYDYYEGKTHMFGATITAYVKCNKCEEEFTVETTVCNESSAFDEY